MVKFDYFSDTDEPHQLSLNFATASKIGQHFARNSSSTTASGGAESEPRLRNASRLANIHHFHRNYYSIAREMEYQVNHYGVINFCRKYCEAEPFS